MVICGSYMHAFSVSKDITPYSKFWENSMILGKYSLGWVDLKCTHSTPPKLSSNWETGNLPKFWIWCYIYVKSMMIKGVGKVAAHLCLALIIKELKKQCWTG
jgi:hypothetical protein